jgi:Tfp pilus assembly protein PilX
MAMLTVLVIMLILTVLGVAGITVTGLDIRVAGFQRTTEAAADAAESCMSTSVKIIQQTIEAGVVPTAVVSATGPVPTGAETSANPSLTMEIMGQSDNHTDTTSGTGATGPDFMQTVNGYSVLGDIDRLYVQAKSGSGMQFAAGYEGVGAGSAAAGSEVLYRVDCRATLAATGTESRIMAVYACTVNGEGCQRKI